jgi:hypothetical protein
LVGAGQGERCVFVMIKTRRGPAHSSMTAGAIGLGVSHSKLPTVWILVTRSTFRWGILKGGPPGAC